LPYNTNSLHYSLIFIYQYLHPLLLHTFPTRRSSDLTSITVVSSSRLSSYFRGAPRIVDALDGRAFVSGLLLTSQPSIRKRQLVRSEEHTSELQSPYDLVCRLLLEKKNEYKFIVEYIS